jgi:predicted HTH transcriptional regulator
VLKIHTLADLQRIVDEGLEESLVLEYKASPALDRQSKAIDELCKDVSAMANSAGGQIIYGIAEDKLTHKPITIDHGVSDPKLTREWIEQIILSRVQPRIQRLSIARISLDQAHTRFAFVLATEPTTIGHQAPDKKYYKRFELSAVPMDDYEIRDVGRRASVPEPFVTFRCQARYLSNSIIVIHQSRLLLDAGSVIVRANLPTILL